MQDSVDTTPRQGFFRRHTVAVVIGIIAGLPLLGGAPFWVPWAHRGIDHVLPDPARPRSPALADDQLVVPMGMKGAEDLFVIDTKTHGIVRQLTDGGAGAGAPTLSADRQTVFFTDRNGVAYAVAPGGGQAELLLRPDDKCQAIRHISVARLDPRHLILDCRPPAPGGGSSLQDFFQYVDLRGLVIRTLKPTSRRVDDPSLAPDGKWMTYWGSDDLSNETDGGAIFKISTDGNNVVKQVTPGRRGVDADPAWSFDGSQISYRHLSPTGSTIETRPSTGDSAPKILLSSTRFDYQKPTWSVDGKQIAALRSLQGPSLRQGPYQVVVARAREGSRPHVATASYASIYAPAWAGR